MKKVLVIGSGISGLSAAIECAYHNMEVILVSPHSSERAQSVMAAGGINAVIENSTVGDSIESHIEDTLKGGCDIAGKDAVRGLCESAPDIIKWLENLGTVFSVDEKGSVKRRAFGGQSHNRTCYCKASTGKQIVTALIMEARRFESLGLIERRVGLDFYSGLIRDGVCYGAIFYNEIKRDLEIITADATIVASGGQNALFGKTTGSTLCDGYVAGKLFTQGVELKNLEFIQYHPTTIETPQKRMLISEAVRGEGGRLYYEESGNRVYFMEEMYGQRGNLMPRDVVSRGIEETKRDVFLDITFLGKKEILKRIPEVYDLCMKYKNLDISKESIPVAPSVHFFMGGIAVDNDHKTNVENLYAVGECASIYHGANRLGGNSLLAAIYSGRVAAKSINTADCSMTIGTYSESDLDKDLCEGRQKLSALYNSNGNYSVTNVRDMMSESMRDNLGIVRDKEKLVKGISDVSYYLSIVDQINYDSSNFVYQNYSLESMLVMAKAVFICADRREESRGAHFRSDYPKSDDKLKASTIISYNEGAFDTYFDVENKYEH